MGTWASPAVVPRVAACQAVQVVVKEEGVVNTAALEAMGAKEETGAVLEVLGRSSHLAGCAGDLMGRASARSRCSGTA